MSSDKPPEFFLHRSLGKTSASRLRAAGHVVHLIADYYPRDAQEIGDAEWIAEGCRRGWTLLTKDRRIRYRTDELGALTSGHLFCLADGNVTLDPDHPALPRRHAGNPPRDPEHRRRLLAHPRKRPDHQDVALTGRKTQLRRDPKPHFGRPDEVPADATRTRDSLDALIVTNRRTRSSAPRRRA